MLKNKLLIFCSIFFITSILSANTTVCYKKGWETPSTIETTPLDGGECKGEKSLKTMQKDGWFIQDIKIQSAKTGLDYSYILTTKNPVSISKELLEKNNVNKELNIASSKTVIENLSDNKATINIGNLQVGQSGIITHKYENGNSLIISSAYVIDSKTNSSTIKLIPFFDLKQNAIPTSNRKVKNGDEFILNYMYDQSLLITPNIDTFRQARSKYSDNNFMHSDIFAAYLKSEYIPFPSKKMIQDFALSQNLGTIFFVIDSNLYIVDTRTFTILKKDRISNISKRSQMPFYTRVEEIESNILTADIWGWLDFSKVTEFFKDDRTEDEILYGDIAKDKNKNAKADYSVYYKNILGLNDDRK